jgi:hypothetical protein
VLAGGCASERGTAPTRRSGPQRVDDSLLPRRWTLILYVAAEPRIESGQACGADRSHPTLGAKLRSGVSIRQLDFYLDEFVFRFNRRTSRSGGLLFYRLMEQAVATTPKPAKVIVGGRP